MPTVQQRYRTILTARLLLEKEGKCLFLEQTPRNGSGFTLPGGKIEGIEFAKDALVRETLEEIGIVIPKKTLELVHVTQRKLKSLIEIIFFFRSTSDWTGDIVVKEPEKFIDTTWESIESPPEKLTNVLTHAFASMAQGKMYSQFPKAKKKVEKPLTDDVEEVKIEHKKTKKIDKKTEKKLKLNTTDDQTTLE